MIQRLLFTIVSQQSNDSRRPNFCCRNFRRAGNILSTGQIFKRASLLKKIITSAQDSKCTYGFRYYSLGKQLLISFKIFLDLLIRTRSMMMMMMSRGSQRLRH